MICPYCKVTLSDTDYYPHIWDKHKDRHIEAVIIELDEFIRNVSIRFVHRYSIYVEIDELMQYLRTSIFIILKDKYDPTITKPSYFAKAACNIFLKRFIQEYYYKRNSFYRSQSIDLKEVYSSKLGYEAEEETSEYVVIDYPATSPLDSMMADNIKDLIYESLTSIEQRVFAYITDLTTYRTQDFIAKQIGISQSSVSYKVKSIRDKTRKILSKLRYRDPSLDI